MAFVMSGGRVAALSSPQSPRFSSIRLTSDLSMDYATLWRTQPHVRTVVGFLARNVAQIGLHAFERVSDTDRRRLTDSPFSDLLRKPNPRTTMYRLLESLVGDMGVYDVACWLKMRDTDGIAGLVRLPPSRIAPIGDAWMWAEGVRFTGSKGRVDIPADQLVLFHGYNPTDATWGISPIETLRQVLAEEFEASRTRAQMWRNGMRFSGHIERPAGATWSQEAKDRFKEGLHAVYTGAGSDAGGTPIFEDGMKFVAGGITPQQAQYLETRKLTREEVAAAYHIPPPMVGVLDNATFSNIEEQHRNLYQDTLGPWLQMIEQEIALQLIPEFDTSGKIYVEFNLAEKLRGTFEEQSQSLQSSTGAPWMTRNEARARMNLPQIVGGDELVTPLNVLIGGQASPQDSVPKSRAALGPRVKVAATDAQRKQIAGVLSRFFEKQRKSVLSRIGAGDTEWWDGARWDTDLTNSLAAVTHTVAAILGPIEAERLGFNDGYDPNMTINFLKAVSERYARNINITTKDQLDAQLAAEEPDPAHTFEVATKSRADGVSMGIGTFVAAFATAEAGRQIAKREGMHAVKTWVTGSNPRPTHAAMSGETVAVGEAFSNGAFYPCDTGNPDDSGCNCSLIVRLQ